MRTTVIRSRNACIIPQNQPHSSASGILLVIPFAIRMATGINLLRSVISVYVLAIINRPQRASVFRERTTSSCHDER